MKTNFIYSTSYYDGLKRIIDRINQRKVSLNERHLLIVPEQYTLLAEKYLYETSEGSFDVEVLSPSRLFFKMRLSTPLLSREGAIMLIRGMLPNIKLNCYFRSAGYRGFCEKLYDAINDFAGSGVMPSDIPSSSAKLVDLKAIYAEYLARIENRYVDSMGKLALIARETPTNSYLNDVHVYVANFDFADNATQKVLDALKTRAISYTQCFVTPSCTVPPASKFNGEGALAVKEAAKRMRYLAYKGVKFEDMAVITGNVDIARVKRIFGEFDIPCFVAESKRLCDHPLVVFLYKLFDCAKSKRRQDVIEMAKNIYSGVAQNSAQFENYVNSRLIDYKGFEVPFSECEQVRERLVSLVSIVEHGKKKVHDALSFGELLGEIFAAINAENITSEAFGTDAPIEKIKALVSLMAQVDLSGNFDFMATVFAEGLKATKMSELPYEGGVIVGPPAAFRGGKYRFTAILGFDDGALPQIYDESSLIGDDEKAELSQMERADMINKRYETELAAVIASSDEVFITYGKPSGMMNELFPKVPQCGDDDVLMAAGSKKHAVEQLISLYRRGKGGENNLDLINLLYGATEVGDKLFMPTRVNELCSGELFFPQGTTSVSQLQSYFRCPFRHFMDYGLRVKERDRGELSLLDVGSFMHEIVENIVREGDYSNIPEKVERIVNRIISEGGKYSLESNREVIDALKKEGTAAVEIYTSHLTMGEFKTLWLEKKFEFDLSGIKLVGKIDMADSYKDYIRIIDYKTGDSEIKYSDVYYGKKIQLPLYMAAAAGMGYKKAAMFNFPLSYSWLSDKNDHRFKGFMLRSDEIIHAIDKTLDDGESEVFSLKLDGGKLGRNDYAINEKLMDAIVDYAVKVAENAVEEIKSGYIAPSPCGDKECEYCDYACLCASKKVRKTIKIEKSDFGGNHGN